MSDPEVPQHEQKSDVDDVVDSANAGLAEAEAARADVNGASVADDADAPDIAAAESAGAPADREAVDPDLAAFDAAERDHPGTFAASGDGFRSSRTDSSPFDSSDADSSRADETGGFRPRDHSAAVADASIADSAYLSSAADDTETRVVPSEPTVAETVVAVPVTQAQQPIFVQAPEPPRERGNRGTAGAIGLLATLAFAVLYLGITLGLGALAGDVTADGLVDAVLAPLMTWAFWTPVVVFFIGFWLLGAIINRGRWGLWVVLGLLVGVAAYFGYILGQLFEAPFWLVTASEASELVGQQLFTPLALAAFVLGRELTIWFGAWVARSGARKTELNDEAQREYERTLEAGPQLSR
ncbi:ABC transporter [Microbacterium sp.]|uniref:ABC transporter n=1 Tax=Microbacterium sp. TaxID=51671 RepID=UPI002C671341|nr:ABC transporter [Microbacterium sp.]HWK76986.1 ABC transporter [Microbacterium sp.]